ncbi:hypothetical protein [Rubricoccus marinus]|uniref:Uncharacterized protein n=1 Tax=Rubricoccus marinus TaxID=716817 RepID=A0A259U3C1_9BACT|nr:hypothetical protein [Rubricoccus marinus]OZC04347.1 hypothetical protein BSZ36_16000 [Rubricoccus marinus]
MPNTYTEREVAQIIERAVVRQEEARRRQGQAGLSLEEIERLGREVGIDPEHMLAAAAEIDAGASEKSSYTTSTHNHVERWTAGPLDIHDWEDAVDDLRRELGTDYGAWYGRTSATEFKEQGATKVWEHTSGLGVHTRLTVSERGERTRVRMEQHVGYMNPPAEGVAYGLLSMILLGPLAGLIGTGLFDGALATGVSLVLGFVLFLLASFVIYKADVKWRAKKHRKLEDLADDLAVRLAPSGPVRSTLRSPETDDEASGEAVSSAAPEANAPRPLLDLDALDVVAPETLPRRRRDRS